MAIGKGLLVENGQYIGAVPPKTWISESVSVTVNKSASGNLKIFNAKPTKVKALCVYGTFSQWVELDLEDTSTTNVQNAFIIGVTTSAYTAELVLSYTTTNDTLKLTYNGGSSASASVSVTKLKYIYE